MKKIIILLVSLFLIGCSTSNTTKDPDVTTSTSKEEIIEPVPQNKISFVGVGDNLIHDIIYDRSKTSDGYDFTYMYDNVKDIISNADLAFVNQETVMAGIDSKYSGYPSFNTPEQMARDLVNVGFNMVNQASNHSLDRKTKGINNTIEVWKNYDVLMAGIYNSQEDRDNIKIKEINGITVAFLAYTQFTNGIQPDNSYQLGTFNESVMRKEITKAREIADVVMVSMHWGTEDTNQVTSAQKQYAKLCNELGVDVILGTHPHVIQPIETITNESGHETLVVYSLGNFVSGMLYKDNMLGGIVSFDIIKENNDIKIENVAWTPTVTHYEANASDIMKTRDKFKIYLLKDYSEELAATHGINGFKNQVITKKYFEDKTNEVMNNVTIK